MPAGSWLDLLRRWRRWLIAAAIVLAVRAGLPEVLRRVLASQASQALRAPVEIGDVDLALLRGGVTLKDVAVRSRSEVAGAESAGPVLISWKRLTVELHYLALFSKTIQLREVVLESPRVALDRLADGQLNLLALVPASSPQPAGSPTPAPEAAATPGWGFGIDRFTLRDGGVHFRDLEVENSEPIDINLEAVEVREIALRPGLYGQPSQIHLALAADDASLGLDARLTLREAGMALEADLAAQNLPLRRARFYIPNVGWSALQGHVDATLAYRFETGTQNEVRGVASVRDLTVQVSQFEEPALAWKNLTVKVDPIDMVARRANVAEVALSGASLLVRPQGGALLPLLTASPNAPPPTAASTSPAPSAAPPAAPSRPATAEAAWQWALASLHVDDTRVRLLGSGAPLDVGVALTLTDLADPAQRPAQVALALTAGGGSLNLDGALRLKSPGFGGTLRIADLSLPELVAAAGTVPHDLLQSARLSSALTVEAGMASGATAVAPGDVNVKGKLALADLRVKAPPPQSYDVGTRSIELTLDELHVGGVLPGGESAPAAADTRASGRLSLSDFKLTAPAPQDFTASAHSLGLAIAELRAPPLSAITSGELHANGQLSLADFQLAGADPKIFAVGTKALELPITELTLPGTSAPTTTQPVRVALGDVRLTNPAIRVTRSPDGLLLPNFAPPQTKAQSPPPPARAPARRTEVAVKSFRLANGNVAMIDRSVKPFFSGRLAPIEIEVRDLRWPELAASDLHVATNTNEQGKVAIFGGVKKDAGWFEVNGDQIALGPFNPYATSFSSYSIAGGTLSLATKGSFAGARYDTDTWLTLHEFDLAGGAGESLFQQQFGIPLTMALALMRDLNGDIVLGIPVQISPEGTQVDVLSVIGVALRHAIVNALASPLKLIGAAFGGEKGGAIAPAPIAFRLGRGEPVPPGGEQIDQLARLMASRASIGVTLEAIVTNSDVRWLREQALREEWAHQGLLAKLGGLTQRAARDRVREALAARAHDQPGELSPEDTAALDRWLDERPAIPPERLQALVEARLAAVEQALREQGGVDAQRIARRASSAEPVDGDPVVRIEVGAAARR
ncbi:MAG TPA: DUF748 domain-containing protein [Candidatus Kryptonia bacterium]|nr:DUF748 domain-containing protein [Candidatus Kryptonia bacterium]